jgi:uncharacterized protein YyaL (SSP411 family)
MSQTSAASRHTNRLIREKSPYLLQHAHNPVDWYAWGEEAFAKARAEDKMVLVSIGYATCHWCHVMERECFENEEIAAFLNKHFVAIKVDREERPDVDKIYMDALLAMGQQGGWPLNVFTTPDGRPVAGGTYFPPMDAHGRRGFPSVLEILNQAWHQQREDVFRNAEAVTAHLQQQSGLTSPTGVVWDKRPVEAAVALYKRTYDRNEGGFTLQPQHKFPPSMGLMLLLRHHAETGDAEALGIVEHTLKAMLVGGIYDQLGGGLCRYSTDYGWVVPHFEKMLYDNALLVQALTEAYLVTGKPFFRAYAEDTIAYVRRDLGAPDGAFYSAEDADSEGEEGRFYVWTPREVASLLSEEDARAAMAYWGITPMGNFEHARTILTSTRPIAAVAVGLGVSEAALADSLQRAREVLFEARSKRTRPLRDDKILASWNGLMISALARAGRAFAEPDLIHAAEQAARFILTRLRDESGRLMRRWREGEARFKAYLVDHGQMANACLDLFETSYDPSWFDEALRLMREVNRLFRNDNGPYYDAGCDAEPLIARTMEGYDGVEPSGNSSAALAFLRLHALGVREGFEQDALRIVAGYASHLSQAGVSFSAMLNALSFHLAPPKEVAIVGDAKADETQAMLKVLRQRFLPDTVVAFAEPGTVADLGARIPLLASRQAVGNRATAYVCRNMTCQLPVHTPQELTALLDSR